MRTINAAERDRGELSASAVGGGREPDKIIRRHQLGLRLSIGHIYELCTHFRALYRTLSDQ